MTDAAQSEYDYEAAFRTMDENVCHRRPSPGKLWQQAEREHPDDIDRLRARYRELMIEHGHLVPREPGDDGNLPCGWPGKRFSDD